MHSSVSALQSAIQLAVQEAGKKKMTEGEYGEKVRSKDSLRVFLCLLFLCDLLYSLGRNRRKHYGLLVPPTDPVNLILMLYGSGRGEYMDLVFEGVLSHPTACPILVPQLLIIAQFIAACEHRAF